MARALVLGGGGVTGVAWELGLLAGLVAAGVDVTEPDVVIGTSAGSVVAAQITSGEPLEALYAAQLVPPRQEIAARMGPALLARFGWAIVGQRDAARARARLGRMALRARTVSEAERRAVIASRLPLRDWPARRIVITAVDAASGEFVTFDRDSGVPLIDAIGASCAVPGVWPPVTIDGRRYIDGGVRSPANADLAAGYDRVIVLAPITRSGGPMPRFADQIAALRRDGRVAVVTPDDIAIRAIGRNALDPAARVPSARAGRAQGVEVAPVIAALWAE